MKTRITELLGIKHPIIQGAMGWVSQSVDLVAAVSEAGGLGILATARLTPDQARKTIREIKQATDKPFGANLAPMSPQLDEVMNVIIDEKVPVFSYGRGNPERLLKRAKADGMIALPTMGAVKHAVRAEQDGADAVIVQGLEGGGHASHVATSVLVPLVADRVKIPVIVAGGVGDARGLVAALAWGAAGISMGTRFIVTKESPAHPNAKRKILESTEEDTLVTTHVTGVRCRVLFNELAKAFLGLPEITKEERDKLIFEPSLKYAFVEGNVDRGSMAAGQICGMIDDIPTCKELIERIVTGAERIIEQIKV